MNDELAVSVQIQHRAGDAVEDRTDLLAREEPLEIQLNGHPLAVVMRTPGADEELATGFLLTERVIDAPTDIARIRHCSVVPDPDAEDNVIQVTLREGVAVDLERLKRNLYASSSCGVCGKATIANVLASLPPLTAGWQGGGLEPRPREGQGLAAGEEPRQHRLAEEPEKEQQMGQEHGLEVDRRVLYTLPEKLRARQSAFQATGGLHAAGLFDSIGNVLVVREDVGRHNAVDKVIGWGVREGLMPLSAHILMVSGRASFEIIQKAAAARVPVVAAVSAPSSLAVSLARALDITLVGFLRGQEMNVYSGEWRIG